jgi:hypothetical protein
VSLVSSRISLIHRCTIQRDQTNEEDSWGQRGEADWQDHLTDLPCRAWTEAAREPVDETTTVTIEDRRVIVELGTDVTEADRLAAVSDGTGAEIFEGPINIEGVLRFPDHLELLLERIR